MNRTVEFEYHYGMQAEAYSFYRIPKVLFTDPIFRKLSCEAKVLYGLMLDRMNLSIKNRWFDDQDRVYIIFTIDEAQEMMGCCKQTAVKLLAELDTQKGIGLIEKKRLGLGRANIIYVKNFMLRDTPDPIKTLDSPQKSKKHTSGSPDNRLQEVQESYFSKSTNHTSESPETELQEVYKTDRNKTETSNTDINKTEPNETERKQLPSNPSIRKDGNGCDPDEADTYHAYQEMIKENMEYGILCMKHGKEDIDGIVDIITDTIFSTRKKVTISGKPVPLEVVRERFMRLEYSHVEYVLECMKKNTTKIRNIKQYLLAVLYNAPATIGHYYAAEVNNDFCGSW